MSKKIWYSPNKFDTYGQAEINTVINCLNEGWLAGTGKYSRQFEKEVAKVFDKKYGLFVNSGSSANILGLSSLPLEKGTKVITPACTFSTTVAPLIQVGFEPVFCDVMIDKFVPSLEQVTELITDDIKVIFIPNLIGFMFDWKGLRDHIIKINRSDIYLIEDTCDTIAKSTYSDITMNSFYATHLITAGGMGGMVMFNDEKLYKRAMVFRDWGRSEIHNEDNFYENELLKNRLSYEVDNIVYDSKYLFTEVAYHMKCCEMCAAFGLVQLTKLDKIKEIRRNNIRRYFNNLEKYDFVKLPNDQGKPDLLAIPLLVKDKRNELMEHLEKNNIQSRAIFSGNITRHPPYRKYLKDFTNADNIMKHGILVGIHQGLSFSDIDIVCNKIIEFYTKL
jgi:CDP-4-dehydro-6-deoxyglucose reductase, E1